MTIEHGFRPINRTETYDDFHYVSYNPSSVDYGSDTTALVFGKQWLLFWVLKGDHTKAYSRLITLQERLEYYLSNNTLHHENSDKSPERSDLEYLLEFEQKQQKEFNELLKNTKTKMPPR